jgi:signal transduction histidine kinase
MAKVTYHILVVDDDDILRAGICDLLELAGYTVSFAVDGAHALKVLERMPQPPALIVSDIRMPNMDGYQFLAEVRQRPDWIFIPFIFLSAKGEKEDIRLGKLRGADHYIPKPFEFQDLLVTIQASLRRYAELSELQEQRLQSLKIRILDVLNHEFRTPLTYIIAYADLMANSPTFEHSAELRQYITGILTGTERLSRLIFNFLTLTELESGLAEKIYERRKTLVDNPDQVMREVLSSFYPQMQQYEMTSVLEVKADPVPGVVADRDYLKVALQQLVDNAVKFSPHGVGAEIRVVIDVSGESLTYEVRDSGPGISLEEQEKLFDLFHQINREKTEQPGTGSGLAIVRHVARLHDGHIRLNSAPGQGSTFILQLPLPAES